MAVSPFRRSGAGHAKNGLVASIRRYAGAADALGSFRTALENRTAVNECEFPSAYREVIPDRRVAEPLNAAGPAEILQER